MAGVLQFQGTGIELAGLMSHCYGLVGHLPLRHCATLSPKGVDVEVRTAPDKFMF